MKIVALLLIALLATLSAQASTFYVATNGSDSNPGTLTAPFRTLYHAQSVMRSSTIKTVTLRGGTYTLTSDLGFYSQDNNTTWIPYVNETPVIDGAGLYHLLTRDIGSFHGLVMEGLTFQHMVSNFNIHGDHVTLRWNTFLNCVAQCVGGDFQQSLIDSNTVSGQHQQVSGPCVGSTNTSEAFVSFNATGLVGSIGNTYSHNLVQNAEGGGFQDNYDGDTFDRNLMINVNTNACDWGAIYVPHGNARVTNNVVAGGGGTLWATNGTRGYYMDDHASSVVVSGNVCRPCGSQDVLIHGGSNNTITNNVFDVSAKTVNMGWYQRSAVGDPMTNNVFTKNIIYTSCTFPTLWTGIPQPSPSASPIISHNIYYSACGASNPNTFGDSSPVFSNPQFADPANGNYSMPSTSPAFTQIGFTALATDQGPLPNPFKTTVTTPQAPTISSFTASPSTITVGSSSNLAWSVSGTTPISLSINEGIGTVTGTSKLVTPSATTTFTLTATNAYGSATRSTTVTVNPLAVFNSVVRRHVAIF